MALWQYTFHLLPKESILDSTSRQLVGDEEGFDDSPFWQLCPSKREVFHEVSGFLKANNSWSDSIDQYGDLDSNCLEVYFENQVVLSVSFRLNYTIDYDYVLTEMLEFCLRNGFVMVGEDLEVVPLNAESIGALIKESSQLKIYKKLAGGQDESHANPEDHA